MRNIRTMEDKGAVIVIIQYTGLLQSGTPGKDSRGSDTGIGVS